MRKYTPLNFYLRTVPGYNRVITLELSKIEQIINDKLPESSYKDEKWWGNQSKISNPPQLQSWQNAGFIVHAVDLDRTRGWVRFLRK